MIRTYVNMCEHVKLYSYVYLVCITELNIFRFVSVADVYIFYNIAVTSETDTDANIFILVFCLLKHCYSEYIFCNILYPINSE